VENTPSTNSVSIVTTKEEKSNFIRFPYNHYTEDTYWVAPLLIEQKKLLNEEKTHSLKMLK
jgi:hypothetical protein